jgi:hypothetical protein
VFDVRVVWMLRVMCACFKLIRVEFKCITKYNVYSKHFNF